MGTTPGRGNVRAAAWPSLSARAKRVEAGRGARWPGQSPSARMRSAWAEGKGVVTGSIAFWGPRDEPEAACRRVARAETRARCLAWGMAGQKAVVPSLARDALRRETPAHGAATGRDARARGDSRRAESFRSDHTRGVAARRWTLHLRLTGGPTLSRDGLPRARPRGALGDGRDDDGGQPPPPLPSSQPARRRSVVRPRVHGGEAGPNS